MSLANPNQNTANLFVASARAAGASTNPMSPAPYFRWQAFACRVVAALLLIPGVPLMACVIILVRLTSRGPAIYRQIRVGKNGRTFHMYKIRSMRIDAEAMTGPAWTLENDPRITRVGRVLRKLHLDELPQLFNVLHGEMSLFGPRPERPEFTHVLAKAIPGFLDRLTVLPGVTGLAQINLPPDSDIASVRRKLLLDLEYIQTANVLLDARMFACTFLRLIGLPGRLAMKVMRLERIPQIEDETTDSPQHETRTPESIISAALTKPGSNGSVGAKPAAVDRHNVESATHADSAK